MYTTKIGRYILSIRFLKKSMTFMYLYKNNFIKVIFYKHTFFILNIQFILLFMLEFYSVSTTDICLELLV